MRTLKTGAVLCAGYAFVWATLVHAQFGRGGGEWVTAGGDAQRSFWIRSDPKISKEGLAKGGFRFLWKVKAASETLMPPVLMDRYIGYRGFRSFGFLGSGPDQVLALDTDLARTEWQTRLGSGSAPPCPGAMTAAVVRSTSAAFPPLPAGRGAGFGRSGPARSGVGKPGEGAVTLADVVAPQPAPRPAGAPAGPPAGPGAAGFRRMPTVVHALASDGMLHVLNVSHGEATQPPARFLPRNVTPQGLIVVDNLAYAAAAPACGAAANAVWALDLASKEVAHWESAGGHIAGSGGPAIGPDGTLYVTTTAGELVALQAKSLKQKASYAGGKPGFASSPVIFQYKEKTLVAAASKDGRVHLLDTAALGTALSAPPAHSIVGELAPSVLVSWQDSSGVRWILAPAGNKIVAAKIVDQDSAPALQAGWVSRDISSPLAPVVINGVAFVAGGSPGVVYALDAVTGKELWNSGKTITSPVRGGGLSGGGTQIYLAAADGTLYAFGFPIEH